MPHAVREVMTMGVTAVQPQASLVEVARLMRDHDIGDVVVARGDDVLGMVTDRDITVRVVAEGTDPQSVSAGAVFSSPAVTISPEDSTYDAARLMRKHAVRRLPVVADGRPVGIVTIGDLAQTEEPDSPLADISAAAPTR
ncbi:CBS domain-containing protein [Wenjunlia tyrosinilytica]|uniref:Oxidoreductase n=1 Tax=Wenjunlia tyrosinilytica TaxID=1544741 RepID=A0A917ZW81_9ACTN|nr:CBS domain-containing protein [Wenjunlia tyrosinilytica]GGO95285.1 oxidoreductase [Wenjunlia tyrosinilytica]